MTTPPFGFGLPSSDDDRDRPGDQSGNPGIPGLPPGFDMAQLGAMLSQLGAMMSSATPSSGPVNYDIARRIALQQLGSAPKVAGVDQAAVRDAVALAEVWLDGATAFPAAATSVSAWSPADWVDRTLPTWQLLVSPVAERMSTALLEGMPEEIKAQAGPMLGMMTSMGSMAFGSQLGGALTQLSTEVLTSSDIGLPLGPKQNAALMPRAMAQLSTSLGIDENQVRLFLALREAAHHRLYHAVPWLQQKIVALIAEYASHTTIDLSAAEEMMSSLDPTNIAALQESLGAGLLAPKPTPGQEAIARRLEALLALVEGWVDTVVGGAAGDRLPGSAALAETLRRRRASGGPAEQTFAALIGVELRPRQLRAAGQLWRDLTGSRGAEDRDALWADYDLLPTASDLDSPDEFIARDKQFSELLAGLEDVTVANFEPHPEAPREGGALEAEPKQITGAEGKREDDQARGTEPDPNPAGGLPDDGTQPGGTSGTPER
jgi:putative hydrolase